MSDEKDLSFYNLKERKWLTRLDRGSIVGHTTSTNTKLWFRFKKKGSYLLIISKIPLKDDVVRKPKETENKYKIFSESLKKEVSLVYSEEVLVDGNTDFTYTLDTFENELVELSENTIYYYGAYNLVDNCWEIGIENSHFFKTMPENKSTKFWDITFGLYSCHMPFDPKDESKADASMWDLMEKRIEIFRCESL